MATRFDDAVTFTQPIAAPGITVTPAAGTVQTQFAVKRWVSGAGGRKEGRKENASGSLLGGYRAADALLATFTATGGGTDLAHISGLNLRAVVYYLEVATEA